jgi:hypothetical protein
MVARVLVAEREAQIDRGSRIQALHGATESDFENGPYRPFALMLALLLVAAIGRMVLI